MYSSLPMCFRTMNPKYFFVKGKTDLWLLELFDCFKAMLMLIKLTCNKKSKSDPFLRFRRKLGVINVHAGSIIPNWNTQSVSNDSQILISYSIITLLQSGVILKMLPKAAALLTSISVYCHWFLRVITKRIPSL